MRGDRHSLPLAVALAAVLLTALLSGRAAAACSFGNWTNGTNSSSNATLEAWEQWLRDNANSTSNSSNCTWGNDTATDDATTSPYVTLLTEDPTVAPSTTTAAPTPPATMAPTSPYVPPTPAPTPVPPTPVPPTPFPTGGEATTTTTEPANATLASTTAAITTTPAPPVTTAGQCNAPPFACNASITAGDPCELRNISKACICINDVTRVPFVMVSTARTVTLRADRDLRIDSRGFYAWCPTDGPRSDWVTIAYQWRVIASGGSQLTVRGATVTGPSLFIPAMTLQVESSFVLVVEATAQSGTTTRVGTTNVTLNVVSPPVTMRVVGGDRTLSKNATLIVALTIDDPFLTRSLVRWSCCTVLRLNETTCTGLCQPPLHALHLFQSDRLKLAPPTGAFPAATVRLFATYKSAEASVGIEFSENADTPEVLVFPPHAQLRRHDRPIKFTAGWRADRVTNVLWTVNGTQPPPALAYMEGQRTFIVRAGAFRAGTLLQVVLEVTVASGAVGRGLAYIRTTTAPTVGRCSVTSDVAMPISSVSSLTVTAFSWARTEAFTDLAMSIAYLRGDVPVPLSSAEQPLSDAGTATAFVRAPLTDAFVLEHQRSAAIDFEITVASESTGVKVGTTRCTATVYSFVLQHGLPEVLKGLKARVANEESLDDVLDASRSIVVAAGAFANSSRAELVDSALAAVISTVSLNQAAISTPSRLALFRLIQRSVVSFRGRATARAAPAATSAPAAQSFIARVAARMFGAQSAATDAAIALPNTTASLIVNTAASAVPPQVTGDDGFAQLLADDAAAAALVFNATMDAMLVASDSASLWRGFSAVERVGEALCAALQPGGIATASMGSDATILSSRRFVDDNSGVTLSAVTFSVDLTLASALSSYVDVPTDPGVPPPLFVRLSVCAIRSDAPTLQLGNASAAFAPGQQYVLDMRRAQATVVSPAVVFVRTVTDEATPKPVPLGSNATSLGVMSFSKAAVDALRDRLAPNAVAVANGLLAVCAFINTTGHWDFRGITTTVGETNIDCSVPAANITVAVVSFTPTATGAPSMTTPAPLGGGGSSGGRVVTTGGGAARIQPSDDNLVASMGILFGTLGGVILIAIGVAICLLLRKRNTAEPAAAPVEAGLSKTKSNPIDEPLLAVPHADPTPASPSPLKRAAPLDESAVGNVTGLSMLGGDAHHHAHDPLLVAHRPRELAPAPVVPQRTAVVIDDELTIFAESVPRRHVDPADDPTPWL